MTEESNHIDAAIADLEAWRDQIETAVKTLRHLQSHGTALPSAPPNGARAPHGGEILHDAFFQMTVPDAAEKYLKIRKSTKPNADVAESLLKGGLKSSSKNFAEMVRSVLGRDSRFVKVNTEWGLTEWYPGMRRGTRAASEPSPIAHPKSPTTPKQTNHGEHKKKGFTPTSLKGRTLDLLNSNSGELFTAKKVGEALSVEHLPSVAAALSTLLKDGLVARPKMGHYQSKKVTN